MKKVYLLLSFLIFLSITGSSQSTITINPATTYQTIVGFGGSGAAASGYDTYLKYVVDLMGMTVFRHYMDGADGKTLTEIQNGTCTYTDGTTYANFFKALKAKGVDTIITTCWSPPACLKDNNNLNGGGVLQSQYYDEYGKFIAGWIKDFEAKTTQQIYAFNVQNEPLFPETYPSGILSAQSFGPCMQAMRTELNAAGLTHVKMHGPEHMGSYGRNSGGDGTSSKYIQNLIWNATYRNILDIYSVHSYTDGIAFDLGNAPGWTGLDTAVRKYGKDLWMTETDFQGVEVWSTLDFPMAQQMYAALKYGKVNAWIYWGMQGNNGMYNSGSPNRRLYVCMQFMRFIRPGYVQIECTESDADVAAIAFKNPTNNDITIVAINVSTTKTKTVNFNNFTNAPSYYHMYRSSLNENCAYQGKFTNNLFTLLPQSVATLYFKASEPNVVYGPSAPTNLTVTTITDNSIKVSWTAAAPWTLAGSSVGITGYTIYVDGVKKTTSGPITTTYYTATGLKPNTIHTIEVITRDAMYNESASASITDTTTCLVGGCTPLPPPDALESVSAVLSLYPNPASSDVSVEIPEDDFITSVTVFDNTGKTVIAKQVTSPVVKLNISGLSKGVYFVITNGGRKVYKNKLLIE